MKYKKEIEHVCPVCNGTGKSYVVKSATGYIVRKLRDQGMSYEAIKNQLGLSSISTIHYHLKKNI